ncbi:aquaporin-like protein [Suillus fuscotomentosus]|uniref:Aquaporin-like protein n=1 Tax=Suillus fuscotomentosus TaxID=1912939 RepID=A0AAD4EG84_9AGAM|nr:aquaporin-like protein [Suillus fuscotomentosus]KAG1905496.1 aquaporin-like protein [Suillus fuscotomentosus]
MVVSASWVLTGTLAIKGASTCSSLFLTSGSVRSFTATAMSHSKVYLSDIAPRPRWMTSWERLKHKEAHWLVEIVAEMMGVFLYVYAGLGATAAFIVGSLAGNSGLGSLYTIGFAYSMGVVFAISLCAATSGGHFNPAVTIASVIFRDFPIHKATRYIIAQILAGYITCLIVYVQWKDLLLVAEKILVEKGLYHSMMFSSAGPAGVFGLYVAPGTNLARVFMNEFVTDFLIGLVIWATLDPTNQMIPPAAAPWLVGMAYAVAVWGYSPTAIAANTARDVGGRLMAVTIWGSQASGGTYAAVAALTNIPATILAALVYELFLGSATRTLTPHHIHFLRAHKQYYEDNKLAPYGYLEGLNPRRGDRAESFELDMGGKAREIQIDNISEDRV